MAGQYIFQQKNDMLLHILSRAIFMSVFIQELHGRVSGRTVYELQESDGAIHSSNVSESSSDNSDLAC